MIVESKQDIQIFLDGYNSYPSIIVPIHTDLDTHPITTPISFLYVRIQGQSYILPFDHTDCGKIELDLSQSTQPKWVWDKKTILQTNLGIQSTHDIQTHYFFTHNHLYPLEYKDQPFVSFYTRKGLTQNLGKTTPIMKWIEYLDSHFQDLPTQPTTDKNWVDETMIPILSDIEKTPIRVVPQFFSDRFPSSTKHIHNNEFVYTQYNPYTMTSRPSNRYGGVNFSALNKNDGSRDIFIPRDNHVFLQFDYDAYHVRIIGKLLNYTLPETSVHQWLADQYGMEYDESKSRTFRILYGGVSDEDKEIPFFNHVDEFIQRLWTQVQDQGYVKTGKGRKIQLEWIENPTPQKVFNYLLQATETEFNIEVMKALKENDLPLPILYVYDSFLFEYGKDKSTERAKDIKSVLESFGFPVNTSWGNTYGGV